MIFTGPLSWESLLSSIPIILKFGLLIVFWISWMFWVRNFLHFALFWTFVWMVSIVSSACDILSSSSCILLVMLASMAPDFFPRFSISRVVYLCNFFIVSTSWHHPMKSAYSHPPQGLNGRWFPINQLWSRVCYCRAHSCLQSLLAVLLLTCIPFLILDRTLEIYVIIVLILQRL